MQISILCFSNYKKVGDLSRENSQDADEPPQMSELSSDETTFRQRSKTLGDAAGILPL